MRDLLKRIVSDRAIEARWLNTLSLLEYVGARKISRTVCQRHPSTEVLKHFSDETRHAYIFKFLGQLLLESPSSFHDYLCREAAMAYFQTLDRNLSAWITSVTGKEDVYQNYLVTTCAIERRAMKLYPLYKNITKDRRIREELEKIIDEEASHKNAIEQNLAKILSEKNTSFEPCQKVEEELFGAFLSSLSQTLP